MRPSRVVFATLHDPMRNRYYANPFRLIRRLRRQAQFASGFRRVAIIFPIYCH
jgi:hypothetical protein